MNAISDFERHNTGGHCALCSLKYTLLKTIVWQLCFDDIADMRRELVLFLFCRFFRKVNIWLK